RFYQWSERAFDGLLHAYERGLDRALRWKLTTLLIFFATLGLSIYLFVIIPKGFFPQQDNGLITATSEASQDISFEAMKSRQEAQGVRLGGRPTRTQFEFTLQDANLAELNEWAPQILSKMQTLPELRDVATDQQATGTTLTLTINRDTASRYGIQPQLIDDTLHDAFGQRQVTQYFTQLNSYHVILEILPELQGKLDTLD